MITQQQFVDAVADFENLILEGNETSEAIAEAANSIGMQPADFERRLTRDMSIELRVEKIRRDTEYNRFLLAAKAVVKICKQNHCAFAGKSVFDIETKVLNIKTHLEKELARELTPHEVWKVGEMLDPFGTQLDLDPKDRRILNDLLQRQIEC